MPSEKTLNNPRRRYTCARGCGCAAPGLAPNAIAIPTASAKTAVNSPERLMTPSRPPGAGPANCGRLTDVCQIFVHFQGGGRWRSAEHQPSAGRFFFERVNAFTLIFLGNDIRR